MPAGTEQYQPTENSTHGPFSLGPALEPACPSVWSVCHSAPLSLVTLSIRRELRPMNYVDPLGTGRGFRRARHTSLSPCSTQSHANHAPWIQWKCNDCRLFGIGTFLLQISHACGVLLLGRTQFSGFHIFPRMRNHNSLISS